MIESEEFIELIKTTGNECAKRTETRLEETLSTVVDKVVKERLQPLNEEKIGHLESQLYYADSLLEEMNNSLVGWFAIKIAKRSIRKKSEKLKKDNTNGKKDIKAK